MLRGPRSRRRQDSRGTHQESVKTPDESGSYTRRLVVPGSCPRCRQGRRARTAPHSPERRRRPRPRGRERRLRRRSRRWSPGIPEPEPRRGLDVGRDAAPADELLGHDEGVSVRDRARAGAARACASCNSRRTPTNPGANVARTCATRWAMRAADRWVPRDREPRRNGFGTGQDRRHEDAVARRRCSGGRGSCHGVGAPARFRTGEGLTARVVTGRVTGRAVSPSILNDVGFGVRCPSDASTRRFRSRLRRGRGSVGRQPRGRRNSW